MTIEENDLSNNECEYSFLKDEAELERKSSNQHQKISLRIKRGTFDDDQLNNINSKLSD